MRLTIENGKRYRAYRPEEFFKSPESTETFFSLSKPKPKNRNEKDLNKETNQKSQ